MRKAFLSVLGVLVALVAIAATSLFFRLDRAVLEPTGHYAIGKRTVVWTEPDPDPFTGGARAIPVELLYPAKDGPIGTPIEGAVPDLSIKHPIVLVASDVGSSVLAYRSIAYELVARGFVVALVGSPGVELLSRGGSVHAGWSSEARSLVAARKANGWAAAANEASYATLAAVVANDLQFALDQVNEIAHVREDALFVSVRVGDVGYAGHGLGGAAAILACARDTRCDAAATIDGPPPPGTPAFEKPLLAVATGDQPNALDALVEATTGPAYSAIIGHSAPNDVSDATRVLPRFLFPSGSVAHPKASTEAARDLLAAFFARHLMQLPVPLLDKPSPLEEVTLSARNAQ
jgi:hypothetical protein